MKQPELFDTRSCSNFRQKAWRFVVKANTAAKFIIDLASAIVLGTLIGLLVRLLLYGSVF